MFRNRLKGLMRLWKSLCTRSRRSSRERLLPLEDFQKKHIELILRHANGAIEGTNGAAAILDIKPSMLRSRMNKLGIR